MSRMLDNLARVESEETPAAATPKLTLVRTDIAFRSRKHQGPNPIIFVAAFLAVGLLAFVAEGGLEFFPYFQKNQNSGSGKLDLSKTPAAQGISALKAGQFAVAEQFLVQATQQNPKATLNWINLGYARKRLGLKKESEAAYQHALLLEPNNIYALNNLGVLLLGWDRGRDAEHLLHQAVEISPTYVDARLNLAVAYEKSEKWPEAFNTYQAFLDQRTGDSALLATIKERARKVRSLATAAKSEEKF
jgi:cytochrome c-type biogenesis protein CcmH/NrfG